MTIRRFLIRITEAAVLVASLAACSQDFSPNSYAAGAVQQASKVDTGIVVGVRQIAVSADSSVGVVTGAAAGGAVGSEAPGGGLSAALGTVSGGLLGGIVGSATQHGMADTTAYEYVVREPKGDLVSVTQQDAEPLQIGTHVLVIAGKQARIVRDYTVTIETPPTAAAGKPPPPPSSAENITLTPPVSLALPGAPPLPTPAP
jgi:outer membrane lipoprotein SlyB